MTPTWGTLVLDTIRTPAAAAAQVLEIQLPRREIWMGLILASALNVLAAGLTVMIIPPDPNASVAAAFQIQLSPLAYFVMVAGAMVLFAHVLTWTGRWIGGEGTLDDLLKLTVWLQFVMILLRVAGLLLLIAVPPIGVLFGLATAVYSLWILLHFIKAGHKLKSLATAAQVLFAAFVGIVVGLSLFLALIGVGAMGVPANV